MASPRLATTVTPRAQPRSSDDCRLPPSLEDANRWFGRVVMSGAEPDPSEGVVGTPPATGVSGEGQAPASEAANTISDVAGGAEEQGDSGEKAEGDNTDNGGTTEEQPSNADGVPERAADTAGPAQVKESVGGASSLAGLGPQAYSSQMPAQLELPQLPDIGPPPEKRSWAAELRQADARARAQPGFGAVLTRVCDAASKDRNTDPDVAQLLSAAVASERDSPADAAAAKKERAEKAALRPYLLEFVGPALSASVLAALQKEEPTLEALVE